MRSASNMVEWKQVASPTIHKIGYEKSTNCMYIDFYDDKPYHMMKGVSEDLFIEFVDTCGLSSTSSIQNNKHL